MFEFPFWLLMVLYNSWVFLNEILFIQSTIIENGNVRFWEMFLFLFTLSMNVCAFKIKKAWKTPFFFAIFCKVFRLRRKTFVIWILSIFFSRFGMEKLRKWQTLYDYSIIFSEFLVSLHLIWIFILFYFFHVQFFTCNKSNSTF